MPFDPIRTDEPNVEGQRAERDFDGQMLSGCSHFVLQSFATYALAVWPHFVWTDAYRVASLGLAAGIGIVPAAGLSILGARKFGLIAAMGSIGGSLAFGIFLHLRLKQVQIPSVVRGAPIPDWPKEWAWLMPSAAVIIIAALSVMAAPRDPKTEAPENSTPKIAEMDSDN